MNTAVLISGGLGTRLRPVTYEIPKPLIPIQGRTLTEHILDVLKDNGIQNVYMSIGHMARRIMDYFGDGSGFGVRMQYLVENEELGTGGWMRLMEPPGDDFAVLNGDNLLDLDYRAMESQHRRSGAIVSIALTEVEDVSSRGVVRLDGDWIVEFVEKPKPEEAPSKLINSGYYVFSPGVFAYLPKSQGFMLERDVFPDLAVIRRLGGFRTHCQWFDTGTFDRWNEAIHKWRKREGAHEP